MRRSSLVIMQNLIVFAKPLLHFMVLAILMGSMGFLCSTSLTVLGTAAVLHKLDFTIPLNISTILQLLVLLAILRGILRYAEQLCNHYIAFRLLAIIRDKVFRSLRRLCPAKLEGRDKGNLIAIITSDTELLEVFYAHTISPIAIAILTSVLMIIFISSFSIWLGIWATIAYLIIGILIPVLNGKKVNQPGMKYRNNIGQLNSLFLDSLRGLGELIQYNKGKKRLEEMNKKTIQLTNLQNSLKNAEATTRATTDCSILFFNSVMLFLSFYLYQKNILTFAESLLATVSLMSSFGPVVAISNLSNNLAQTFASAERVLNLLEETPIVKEKADGKNIHCSNITCEKLTFSYDKTTILKDISLEALEGKITGIYGKSGCGKSTLLKLFMRFWDKSSGKILLSNTEISEINTHSLRENESYCTQETHLFNDTIGNNIGIANPNATKDDIICAAKKASLHEFIQTLPYGYDTPIGELGDRLSGGEKQRIGIARAFLSSASIMLLDEPTSNLDSLNEGIILKSLYEERQNRTIVLVSHRQSTLGIASKIYSLSNERSS